MQGLQLLRCGTTVEVIDIFSGLSLKKSFGERGGHIFGERGGHIFGGERKRDEVKQVQIHRNKLLWEILYAGHTHFLGF